MPCGARAEVVGEGDGAAGDGVAHEPGVDEEAAEEGSEGEGDGGGVGRERVVGGESAGDEGSEGSHEKAGDDADDDAFAGDGAVGAAAEVGVGAADEDDGEQGEGDSGGKQREAAFGLDGVAEDDSFNERDADGEREGDGESGDFDSGDEEQIGDVEDESAERGVEEIACGCAVEVEQEAGGAVRRGAHGEGEQQGEQNDADGIVPVEKLEAIAGRELEGVGPRSPADGAGDHHEKGEAKGERDEHERFLCGCLRERG